MPVSTKKTKHTQHRDQAAAILRSINAGGIDPYVGYKSLYRLWCSRNAAVSELRPLFKIPGINADSNFSVTDEFRMEVCMLAKKILPLFANTSVKNEAPIL